MKILVNHVGYNAQDPKKCIIRAPKDSNLTEFNLMNFENGEKVFTGKLEYTGPVAQWRDWEFWTGDFSDFTKEGTYVVSIGQGLPSAPFEIENALLQHRLLKTVLFFFKTQRASGIWNKQDYEIPFYGKRKDTVDVHGGYYDASGDMSKYLSHLSYANYMNPQQTPLTVWVMANAVEYLVPKVTNPGEHRVYQTMCTEEAAYGADFLVRMQDEEGYFYMTVFDRWSKDPKQRAICSYKSMRGEKQESYQAGYRQGGGMAIAALARAARLGISGDYTVNDYLYAAVQGFEHLEKNNERYLDDGKENIIDDYCALMAAVELYNTTHGTQYLAAARKRANNLIDRKSNDKNYKGWFRADEKGDRPYFHAAEAGLPLVALNFYCASEPETDLKVRTAQAIHDCINFELDITNEVNNPFGYPRQYVKSLKGNKRGAFFFPHENESAYWWQGENARLASLSTAASVSVNIGLQVGQEHGIISKDEFEKLKNKLSKHSTNQFDWILGLNPFDTCFLKGAGRRALDYHWSAPGGIANGITAKIGNEEDIAFMMEEHKHNGAVSWRWCEQWLPHSSWFLMALVSQFKDV